MPELPEVETVVRSLRDDVVGRTFSAVSFNWPRQIVAPSPAAFAERLVGQRIDALNRRGKYIVFSLSEGALLIHLKMTGRLYMAHKWRSESDDRYRRAVFVLDDGHELVFSDQRKFGRLYLTPQADDVIGDLGPEPLYDDFTLETFRVLLSRRHAMIKPLLLNQRFIAGIGNIYADEALWRAQIDPRRKADTLQPAETDRLHRAIQEVLREGIQHEGASINWYRKPDGTTGEHQNHFSVYEREDKPCPRCGTLIDKIKLGQRGTHYCPTCQN